ncbi:hypothetical protein BaRGS_00007329 [Batillaria attramentaria]|uniref:BMP-binding endothelial regulator protein n=1 Tax=Batillaria attramentaria TaxID=370345 RepID=A0ABD0LQM1_9CAEN
MPGCLTSSLFWDWSNGTFFDALFEPGRPRDESGDVRIDAADSRVGLSGLHRWIAGRSHSLRGNQPSSRTDALAQRSLGCKLNGTEYRSGHSWSDPSDPCQLRQCRAGVITESTERCFAHCPSPKSVPGQCCPKCPGACRWGHGGGSGTSVCSRVTCPPLDCPPEERTRSDDTCCEACPPRRHCTFSGIKHAHKEEWRPNPCVKCSCEDGVTYCQRERCSNSLWCPQGYQLRLHDDACCPKCVEHDAVCTVFGDPHYRTYDGRMYNFQGGCKYLLTRDCRQDAFTIKVRNGVRFNSGFAWTQMLAVFLGKSRISLLQNLKVKVDRKRVALPYNRPGVFSIRRTGRSVRLRAQIGLEVVWDGDSFLEVTVSSKYKNRLCGLCGNYNGLKSDDLTGSDGKMYSSGEEFGNTWRIGSKRACKTSPNINTRPLCGRDPRARQRAHRVCSVFYGHSFKACRLVVPVQPYVSSCITDMCDCPVGRYCACEAVKAYWSQCSRAGVRVAWGRQERCFPPVKCPEKADPVLCSNTCPRTCSNLNSLEPCPTLCDTGCLCNGGAVLHDEECIAPERCPAS